MIFSCPIAFPDSSPHLHTEQTLNLSCISASDLLSTPILADIEAIQRLWDDSLLFPHLRSFASLVDILQLCSCAVLGAIFPALNSLREKYRFGILSAISAISPTQQQKRVQLSFELFSGSEAEYCVVLQRRELRMCVLLAMVSLQSGMLSKEDHLSLAQTLDHVIDKLVIIDITNPNGSSPGSNPNPNHNNNISAQFNYDYSYSNGNNYTNTYSNEQFASLLDARFGQTLRSVVNSFLIKFGLPIPSISVSIHSPQKALTNIDFPPAHKSASTRPRSKKSLSASTSINTTLQIPTVNSRAFKRTQSALDVMVGREIQIKRASSVVSTSGSASSRRSSSSVMQNSKNLSVTLTDKIATSTAVTFVPPPPKVLVPPTPPKSKVINTSPERKRPYQRDFAPDSPIPGKRIRS